MTIQQAARTLRQGFRLRCPRCGNAPLFRGIFRMYERCAACGLLFEREQGYFVGAIYVNYAATTGVIMTGFLVLDHYVRPSLTTQILLWGAVGVVFPLFFFRYARSLWLSVEYLLNPEVPAPGRRR